MAGGWTRKSSFRLTTAGSGEVDDSHTDNLRPVLLSSEGKNVNRPIFAEFNNEMS